MLSCVVNLSEGADEARLDELATMLGAPLLDVHRDAIHNRSVFTLASPRTDELEEAVFALMRAAFDRLDLRSHAGVHPRLGVVDVVPFVPLVLDASLSELAAAPLDEAMGARDRLAKRAAAQLDLPCFLYGPSTSGKAHSLPEIRRDGFRSLLPDYGPSTPHERAGASCVGARRCLVAYNVLLDTDDLGLARAIATELRSPAIRSLAFALKDAAQVSCNLVAPWAVGPRAVYDTVARRAPIRAAELVGLVPAAVLEATEPAMRPALDLSAEATLEARFVSRFGPSRDRPSQRA